MSLPLLGGQVLVAQAVCPRLRWKARIVQSRPTSGFERSGLESCLVTAFSVAGCFWAFVSFRQHMLTDTLAFCLRT